MKEGNHTVGVENKPVRVCVMKREWIWVTRSSCISWCVSTAGRCSALELHHMFPIHHWVINMSQKNHTKCWEYTTEDKHTSYMLMLEMWDSFPEHNSPVQETKFPFVLQNKWIFQNRPLEDKQWYLLL